MLRSDQANVKWVSQSYGVHMSFILRLYEGSFDVKFIFPRSCTVTLKTFLRLSTSAYLPSCFHDMPGMWPISTLNAKRVSPVFVSALSAKMWPLAKLYKVPKQQATANLVQFIMSGPKHFLLFISFSKHRTDWHKAKATSQSSVHQGLNSREHLW